MFKDIYKKFFFTILIFLFLILILFTFNTNLRKLSLNYLINGYKVYMTVLMQTYLKKPQPDYDLINIKLKNFIKVSKKISSGESKLIIGIYDAANLVQSSIINEKNFGALEDFFLQLSELDPRLYEAKIWYAKSLISNNKIDDALKQIDEAIKLSPMDPEPYRLALKIFLNQNNSKKFKDYCKKYLISEFGGKQKRYQYTKFEGFNFNDFAIKIESSNSNKNNQYIIRGINNGNLDQYELIPSKPTDVSEIKMIFTFNPGTILEIKNLKLFSKSDSFEIQENELIILSNNLFFNNKIDQKQIIFTEKNNQIVKLKLNQTYKKIDKILFTMKFDKLSLINKNCQ